MPKLSFHPTIDPLQLSNFKAIVLSATQGLYDQTLVETMGFILPHILMCSPGGEKCFPT